MFRLGINFPLPYVPHGDEMPAREALRHLRLNCGVSDLRINLDVRLADPQARLTQIRDAGLIPVPILHWDAQLALANLSVWGKWCGDIARTCDDVELWNEPANDGNTPGNQMSAKDYALLVTTAAGVIRAIRPETRIWIAMDGLDLGRGRLGTYHHQVTQQVPRDLYDGVALHPYRGRYHPDSTSYVTRRREWQLVQRLAGAGVPIWVTEVGWSVTEVGSARLQAEYVSRELLVLNALGAVGACIYAHQGPHGMFEDDWTPRPAAYVLADLAAFFQQEVL